VLIRLRQAPGSQQGRQVGGQSLVLPGLVVDLTTGAAAAGPVGVDRHHGVQLVDDPLAQGSAASWLPVSRRATDHPHGDGPPGSGSWPTGTPSAAPIVCWAYLARSALCGGPGHPQRPQGEQAGRAASQPV